MRDLLINLCLAVGSLMVFGGLTEVGVRLTGLRPEERINPIFSWKERGELWTLDPGSVWKTRVGGHPVHANSYGLRGREIAPRKPGSFRILVLGDSVTFGHGQPNEVTFVRQLEQLLAPRLQGVEVINGGVPGWSTRQQHLFYRQHGEALAPDLVLVGFVLNDVTEIQNGLVQTRGLAASQAVSWLSERSAVFAALKAAYVAAADPAAREIEGVQDVVFRVDAPEVRRAMDLTLQEMRTLSSLVSAQRAKFGVVMFPFRFQFAGDQLDAPQRRLTEFAAAEGMAVLDTLPILRGHGVDAVLMDADHFTPLGHRVVAEALAEWLPRAGLVPVPGFPLARE